MAKKETKKNDPWNLEDEKHGKYFVGAILLVLGIYFLLSNLGIISASFSVVWPFFLIIPGAFLIWKAIKTN